MLCLGKVSEATLPYLSLLVFVILTVSVVNIRAWLFKALFKVNSRMGTVLFEVINSDFYEILVISY